MFKFIREQDTSNRFSRHTVEIVHVDPDANIEELEETFEYFLKACGYRFDRETEDES